MAVTTLDRIGTLRSYSLPNSAVLLFLSSCNAISRPVAPTTLPPSLGTSTIPRHFSTRSTDLDGTSLSGSEQSQPALVTIDTRALIDKVLSRYSGEFTVFRELLQNSEDAGCDSVEIRFETAVFLDPGAEAVTVADLETNNVVRWTFKNHGKPFAPRDWERLTKIASGNPDPHKVGAFGVGFYSVFSVTDSPYVSSGHKGMQFFWNDENQLSYRSNVLAQAETGNLWTTFKLQLRNAEPMPAVSKLMQFLASSLTFMVNLTQEVPQVIPIPSDLKRSSPEKHMTVESVQRYPIAIKAGMISSTSHSMPMCETEVDLTVFTAEVNVTLGEKLFRELNRCTKKDPPSHLKYSLIYTGKAEYDQSCIRPRAFPSDLQGLRADIEGAGHTRVFIGHATAQTTGTGGHMASCFIPTVERESVDLVNTSVAVWNRELLYVGGFLCRLVYQLELSEIDSSWKMAASETAQYELQECFLHVLKFFAFHHSTPSSKVAELLAESFYECSAVPLSLLTIAGVHRASDARPFDKELGTFLKSLPMLSSYIWEDTHSISKLPALHDIPAITPSDVLHHLPHHTLDVRELITCLRWWITARQNGLAAKSNTADLLVVTTHRTEAGTVRLSSMTHFINPAVLGPHVPPGGPLPPYLVPLNVSVEFSSEELGSFGWEEFTVTLWLQYILHPDVTSANEGYDMTRSQNWASLVLRTLSRIWLQLSEDTQINVANILGDKACIPTSDGLREPECSYLPSIANALLDHLGLPTVTGLGSKSEFEVMKRPLLCIGVQQNIPVKLVLSRMGSTKGLNVFDLLDYVLENEHQLKSEDLSALKSSRVFMRESISNTEMHPLCRADELHPPVSEFRSLRLPVIKWNEESEWSNESDRAQLLYRLGLNRFPSLSTIVKLSSSIDVDVRDTAFEYLVKNLKSQYCDCQPEDFSNMEFVPAESKNDHTCLRRPGEVYSGTQWKELGFFVVPSRYVDMPLYCLGVAQHPPTSKILDLLEKTPPNDEETARYWFEVLYGHKANFSHFDRMKLSGLPFVLVGPPSAPRLLPPAKCHLDEGTRKPALYEKLFIFVNFGTTANGFLEACGSKNRVSADDVAEVLLEDPERFFELAGGYEGFLVELKKLAYKSNEISNVTLNKMSCASVLLGLRKKKSEGLAGWGYEHRFLPYSEVTIVDDISDYQLFSDHLFVAPQDDGIERFYESLGCSYLSAVVTERYDSFHEIQLTKTCSRVESLIIERLPLFMQMYADTEPKVPIPSGPDRLKVKACKRILVFKTLVTRNVEREKEPWTTARCEGKCIELWISEAAKHDMYEVATSLCRLLFGASKMDATLLLETILSADWDTLEQRGFPVDQISRRYSRPELGSEARCIPFSRSTSTTVTYKTSPGVIPQDYIRCNVERAVKMCGFGGKDSDVHEEVCQFIGRGFCRVSVDPRSFRRVGQLKGILVCVGEGTPNTNTFMKDRHGPLCRFADIIVTLSGLYDISPAALHIFYDVSGGCLAFNCRRTIYLNLRYFEDWHDKQVKTGRKQVAQMSWFLVLAHEIAHNLTDEHDADHEFWFSAICEAHLMAFSQLLRPAIAWPHYALCLMGILVILFAYFIRPPL